MKKTFTYSITRRLRIALWMSSFLLIIPIMVPKGVIIGGSSSALSACYLGVISIIIFVVSEKLIRIKTELIFGLKNNLRKSFSEKDFIVEAMYDYKKIAEKIIKFRKKSKAYESDVENLRVPHVFQMDKDYIQSKFKEMNVDSRKKVFLNLLHYRDTFESALIQGADEIIGVDDKFTFTCTVYFMDMMRKYLMDDIFVPEWSLYVESRLLDKDLSADKNVNTLNNIGEVFNSVYFQKIMKELESKSQTV